MGGGNVRHLLCKCIWGTSVRVCWYKGMHVLIACIAVRLCV